ncbi:MAG: GIY-YIG nuclease family protein [Candidatus Cyclobacteriaceae bacterium M2_1C_046]
MHHVYILKSQRFGIWYYGYSENPDQRVFDHQTNRAKFTRNKGPWKLIFLRPYDQKTDALKFEQYLKKTRNKGFIKEKFKEYFLSL